MLDDQPAPDDLAQESIADFMARRNQEVGNGALGTVTAPEADGDGLEDNQDPDLSQPTNLANYAARFAGGGLLGPIDQLSQGSGLSDGSGSDPTDGGDGQDENPGQSPDFGNYVARRYKGAPKFNQFERYWRGTPNWSKVATVDALGHPIAAATAEDPQQ